MSIGCEYESDGMWFPEKHIHRSAKQRKCIETFKTIEVGEPYVRLSGLSDGEFWSEDQSLKGYHICRALHQIWFAHNGHRECVIMVGGLPEVDYSDLVDYFGLAETQIWATLLRVLKWAGVVRDSDHLNEDSEPIAIGEPTEEDWNTVSALSRLFRPDVCAPYDALGNPWTAHQTEVAS